MLWREVDARQTGLIPGIGVRYARISRGSQCKHAQAVAQQLLPVERGRADVRTIQSRQVRYRAKTGAAARDSQPEVPIFTGGKRRIPAANGYHQRAPHETGMNGKQTVLSQPLKRLL